MTRTDGHSEVPAALTPRSGRRRRYASIRTTSALMLREMSTRYGRSPGGYLWALLEPLGTILLLGFGFSLLIRTPSLGTSFILFYATGFLPFNLYQTLALYVARAIVFSKPLLFYPSVTWIDALLARFILNALTGIMVAYLLLVTILGLTETRTVLEIGPLLTGMGLSMLLGLGIGTLNCVLIGLIPVWDLIWSIATRPLFLISGVIFLYEDMPRFLQELLWYNPLMHVIGIFRTGFYPMYTPQYVSVLYVVICSLTMLVLGLILLGRYHRDILNT